MCVLIVCRYMLGLAGVPSLVQLIGFIFLPESPRWMMKKGNEFKARSILQAVRGTDDIEDELNDMRHMCNLDEQELNKGN